MATPANTTKKPQWLKTDIAKGSTLFKIKKDLRAKNLVTVCEEAKCPNIATCWNTNTATFMVLGDTCTRACRFCHIKTGNPQKWLDPNEPKKISDSCSLMKLKYVVITMVDRDDLDDGGADHLSQVIRKVKKDNPKIKTEILCGDFNNKESSLQTIIDSNLDVFAHNVETIRRLSPRVRDARASYEKSLEVLSLVKKIANYKIFSKSSIMLGLGETIEEVEETLYDLKNHQVDFITIGQYMRPTKKHLSVKEWVHPKQFEKLELLGKKIGFKYIVAGPLVRSSYKAHEFFTKATS
jgi:lipoyl synthase